MIIGFITMKDNALKANSVLQTQIYGLLCITRTPRMAFYNTLFLFLQSFHTFD